MLYKTYHKGMRPCVAFQIIDFGLLDVADIAYPYCRGFDGAIQRDELTDSRLVVQRCKANILAPIMGE